MRETSTKGTMDPEGARLLTLLYAYGKPRLCINVHHYAPPPTVLQQAERWHECVCKVSLRSAAH